LSGDYVTDLASGGSDVEIVLTEAGEGRADARDRRLVYELHDASGSPAAHLIALLDDSALESQLAELDRGLLFAGLLAIVLALLVGVGSALWLSRPLAELEEATRRVGAGDLTATVTVRSGGEVGKALGAFNDMTRELRRTQRKLLRAERIAAWRDIARRIAHEIKNPLSPIQISIETMRKTYKKQHPDFPEIFEESTLTILEEVERLRRIVTEFSQFARMPRPRSDTLDMADIASHVVSLHRDDGVALEIRGAIPKIKGDRDQLTQVLENLVKNGLEAKKTTGDSNAGSVGDVTVVVEPWGDGVTLRIMDSGPGIPEDDRLRIFEPYYTTKAGGTGLGLAIVHRIVGDHNGSLEIGDAPTGGAEFIIQLPAEGPPPEASASMTESALPLIRKK
jgi:nitrogen fixation/metabolism regulation signal transduction histidine kinase